MSSFKDLEQKLIELQGKIEELEEKNIKINTQLTSSQAKTMSGSWTWYIREGKLEWSEGMYDIFGYSKEMFNGDLSEAFETRIHPDDKEKVRNAYKSIKDHKNPSSIECRIVLPGGIIKNIWSEAGDIILDKDSKPKILTGVILDITKQKKTEQALIRSQYRLIQIISQSPFPVEVCDKSGNVALVNKAFLDLFHIQSADLLIGKYNIFSDPYLKILKLNTEIERAYSGETVVVPEVKLPVKNLKNSRQEYYQLIIFPVCDVNNEVDQVLVVFKDITLWKEADLRYKKFEKAIGSTKASIIITDYDGKIEYANPYFNKVTGFSPTEYLGKSYSMFRSEAHDLDTYKNLWDTIKSGNTWEGELFSRKKNGEHLFENVVISPISDEKNDITNFVVIKTDITQGKKLAEKLEENEQKYRTAFYMNPCAISINKLDGTYINVNEGFAKLTGFTQEEVLYKSTAEIDIWVYQEDKIRFLKELKENDKVENLEVKFRLKNGEIKIGLISAVIITLKNEPHILSITRDINERKLIEKELREAKEKAEESDRLKTSFLHNMSHEIRTPLNAIVGFSGIMAIPGQSSDKLKLFADMISSSSEKLIDIITDVIEISQLQAQKAKLNSGEVKISSLVENILPRFQQKAAERNINLHVKDNIDPGFTFITDAEKLKRIISHLLDNAIKFTFSGGIIFSIEKDEKDLILSFTDTGIGIDKDQQKIIFEPFRQAETGLQRNFEGNGLGLSLVKSYSELLKGKVCLISEEGRGTNVIVKLPINNKCQNIEKKNKIRVVKETHSETTILIAEDEIINYIYLKELLQNNETIILHASNGQEAIDLCKENEFIDIILMDIKMPVMDGNIAARLIKEFRPDLPIIGQSAYMIDSDHSNIFDDFISKPIRHQALKAKLKRYLRI
ncbi:MAG TPA: PAS domain S-box protein [Bacteroidales bacterium]|nr:PAS domain S-box protein [Bacteroidales bacterium]